MNVNWIFHEVDTKNIDELRRIMGSSTPTKDEALIKEKILTIGLLLYPVIRVWDMSYIALILKESIEHLNSSETFQDYLGGRNADTAQIIEILNKIKDAFFCSELMVCENNKQVKNEIIDFLLS